MSSNGSFCTNFDQNFHSITFSLLALNLILILHALRTFCSDPLRDCLPGDRPVLALEEPGGKTPVTTSQGIREALSEKTLLVQKVF